MIRWSKNLRKPEALFPSVFLITQIATLAVFLGRAWQHLRWDAPYRALLWDEKWMRGIIERLFHTDWQSYITSSDVDRGIQGFIQGMGWFYLLCAISVILIRRWGKAGRMIVMAGGVSLIFLALLDFKEKFLFAGQFLEYALQFGVPFILAALSRQQKITSRLITAMKWLMALTFTCHGLFAIGAYPRPGYFVEMTVIILGITENAAVQFLIVAGVLDFMVSALIFFPGRLSLFALMYATLWGFATSMARITAYFHWEFWQGSLSLWGYESLCRFPHFLIPLALVLIYVQRHAEVSEAGSAG